jgi:AcrR family transcriptional regulator
MAIDTGGLRESKKQETRQLISDHATRLFVERGFEATTLADIAAAARVAKKTVTNYYARKEDMALDRHEEFVAGLAHTVGERGSGESALAALRREFLAGAERRDPVIGFSGPVFARMIADSPTLLGRLRDLHDQRERALETVLVAETGAADGDLVPRAAAVQLGGAHRVLFQYVLDCTLAGTDNDRIATGAADAGRVVFGMLEGSLGEYAVR